MEDLYSKDYKTLNGMIELMLKSDQKQFTYNFFKNSNEFKGLHVDVLKRLIIQLKDDNVVDGNRAISPDAKEWVVRTSGLTERFIMDGGYKDVTQKQHKSEHGTTNIHAENVQYNHGSNYGSQSLRSKNRNKSIANKADSSMIRNLVIAIISGVIVGLVLYYIFGISG